MIDVAKDKQTIEKSEVGEVPSGLLAPPVVPPIIAPPVPHASPIRHAKVTVPGTHAGEILVEFPRDAENPTLAAIEAAKAARGIVSFGAGPEVEFLD